MSDWSDSPRNRILDSPGTLRLLSHIGLADMILGIASDFRDVAVAESIQRAWLFSGGATPFAELPRFRSVWQRSGLSDDLISALDEWFLKQRVERTYDLPDGWACSAPSGLQLVLRELLHAWRVADGTIVFVRTNDDPDILPAMLLPFIVHEKATVDQPSAIAQDGNPDNIHLSDSINLANEHARRKGWIGKTEQPLIELLTLPGKTDVNIGGASGGLPILIAHRFRHAGLKIPALRLGASGVLTSAGGLSPALEEYATKRALFRAAGIRTIILPEPIPSGWPCGQDLSSRLDSLMAQYEDLPTYLKDRVWDFSNYIERKRQLFTGREWIFEQIDLWPYHPEERAMLIVGEPGIGKSSIVAQRVYLNPGEQVVAHHFCQADETETLHPGRFVQSIAAMLASHLPDFKQQLKTPAVIAALSSQRCDADPAGSFSEGILVPLRELPAPDGGVRYVLIDALDEALIFRGRPNIVDVLSERIERLPQWLRVVATTRDEHAVRNRLGGLRILKLEASNPENSNDIDTFIASRLESPELAEMLVASQLTKSSVGARLLEKADGNFLYAVTVLEGIQRSEYRLDCLEELPPGLNGLYLRFFERVFQPHRDGFEERYNEVRPLLEVMVAARKPLTRSQLAAASGLDEDDQLPKWLRSLGQWLRRTDSERINLFHSSFRDWLASQDHDYGVNRKKGHALLVEYCTKEHEVGYYGRNFAVEHFVELEQWDRAADLLSDLKFIAGRARAGESVGLQRDYALALQQLPEAQEDNRREQSRREDVDRWTHEIVNYAAEWSARRRSIAEGSKCSDREPALPKPPRTVARWSEQRISAEVNRIRKNPNRLDRARAFSTFVANSTPHLDQFCRLDGFVVQHALNSDPSGLVFDAGKRLLSTITAHMLLRKWQSEEHYTPCPACLRLLNGSGPVCITPDGRRAISADAQFSKNVIVWDLETGKCIYELRGHLSEIHTMSMTPDGKKAVSAGSDKTLHVWDLETGENLKVFNDHSGQVYSVSITPDGCRAVSTSDDDTLRVWNLELYSCERIFDDSQFYSVNDICISPDGRRAFSVGSQQVLKAWDLEEGGLLLNLEGQSAPINGLAITPDESRAITADRFGELLVWDLKTGERLHKLQDEHDRINSVEMTADGERAISAGPDRTLLLWSAETGQKICVLEGHSGEVDWVSMTVDGRRAISAGDDYTLRVWDLEKGGNQSKASGIHKLLMPIVFAAVGHRGVSGEENGLLRIWDLQNGTCSARLEGHSKAITHIGMSADGRIAVSVGKDNFIRAWDLDRMEKLNEHDLGFVPASAGLSVSPNGHFVLMADVILYKWHIATGRIQELRGHSGMVTSVVTTPDGRYAVSTGLDDTLRIWDVANGQFVHEFTASSVTSMGTTPEGRRVIFVSSDDPAEMDSILTVLDLESGQPLWRRPGVKKAIVTPDGRRLIVANSDKTMHIADLETGAPLSGLLPDDGGIRSLSVSPDGRYVIFSCWDRTLRVWDLEGTGANLVMGVPALVRSVFIGSQPSHWVAVTDSDLLFLHPHNFPTQGPLLTTASRVVYSQDAAPGIALARPSCCGVEFNVPAITAQRIDGFAVQAPSTTFNDEVLLIRCPHCQTLLRLNPFFLDIDSPG